MFLAMFFFFYFPPPSSILLLLFLDSHTSSLLLLFLCPWSFSLLHCEYSTLEPFSVRMGEHRERERKKTLGFMILFFTSSGRKKKKSPGEGFLFYSPLSSSISLLLVCLPRSVSLFPLHSVPFIHIQQSIIF